MTAAVGTVISRSVTDSVWKHADDSVYPKRNGLYFKEDLSPGVMAERARLWPEVEKARKEGRKKSEDEQHTARRCHEFYNNWLSTFASNSKDGGIALYSLAYRKAKRAETVNNFTKMLQRVPSDLLKRAFLKLCNSPEAFLSLRSHFISSHALLCVSHWILGIGDRHLSNFMINVETGGMVGIDFGHAFGSATQFLPVPELMPFRLTGQLVSPMRLLMVYFVSVELKLGFEKDLAFPGMQSVAVRTKEHNIRAKLPASDLSVEQQVDCLLDQAMDQNASETVYAGWEAWMRCFDFHYTSLQTSEVFPRFYL